MGSHQRIDGDGSALPLAALRTKRCHEVAKLRSKASTCLDVEVYMLVWRAARYRSGPLFFHSLKIGYSGLSSVVGVPPVRFHRDTLELSFSLLHFHEVTSAFVTFLEMPVLTFKLGATSN